AMIHDNLTGGREAYKEALGIATPELLDDTDRMLATGGEVIGSLAVPIPMVGAANAGRVALTTPRVLAPLADDAVRPIDALVDMLSGGNRAAVNNFATAAGPRVGSLAAAEAAGLNSAAAFAGAAANTVKTGAFSVTNHMGTLLANTALTGGRLATVAGFEVAKRTAGFSLRHPFMATGAAVGADMAWNNGQLTGAATRGATNFAVNQLPGLATSAFGAATAAAPALLPNFDFTNMLRGRTVMKTIEESLGIDIPDTWEAKGNQLMRDFGNSSFGQWLVGGSWGSKVLLGLLAFVLFDGIKDRILGDGMATNMLSLGVGLAASQMLPQLLEAMMAAPTNDNTAPSTTLEADTRPPQTLDFGISNPGGMSGGMSFAPAGP
ncbi:MAG: hypothetical protein KJ667_01235, partial [Alphaproteobacteria bacterium]|nr:hypothetical protein [Alphaproteobacteria bacterium]